MPTTFWRYARHRVRLTALQLPARFGEAQAQLHCATLLLEAGPRTDLVLFPETALTGYVSADDEFDLARFAEPLDGPTVAALAHLARRFDCLVVGPLVEREGAACFNALVGIAPTGERLLHYRKRHPWFPETWAAPGEAPTPVFSWRGACFAVAICFDVHFLAEESGDALRAADALLFSSAWVDDEGDARPEHLRQLARAHGVAVLNANWGPGVPAVHGQGGSLFVGASGALEARLSAPAGRLDVELVPSRRRGSASEP